MEKKNSQSVDWKSNKAVGIAAVIVLLIGIYLIWQQVTQPGPSKTIPYICIRPDGTIERFSVEKNSKWWQETWVRGGCGFGPGPCFEGQGEAYAAAQCPECGHTFLDRRTFPDLPPELTHPTCPECARLKVEWSEEEEEEKEED